jgi:hypothetical protein
MATPTYKELLEGSTLWRKTHKGVSYLLSHHGYRKNEDNPYDEWSNHPGTWCYYLLIPEQMFPHRWDEFKCSRSESGFERAGLAWDSDWFDTEITFAESKPEYCRKTERVWDGVKVGCDYGHSWHRDMGFPDTYSSVNRDAIITVEKFLNANPDHFIRSRWSGLWGKPEEFYTAINGVLVHKDDEIPDKYDKWKPTPKAPD